jgi:hypothetical protein
MRWYREGSAETTAASRPNKIGTARPSGVDDAKLSGAAYWTLESSNAPTMYCTNS